MYNLLIEHQNVSGTAYKDCLLIETYHPHLHSGCYLNECQLNESTSNNKTLLTFRGKFQEAEQVNKNKRLYPRVVLDENVKRLEETVKSRGLVGELDHPTDSIIHFKEASHIITKLWWDNNTLMGEGQILNTAHGKQLKALLDDGVRIGISSRGVGNGKVNEDGILVIGESYKLITFDAVADPSTYAAFQQKVSGKTEESVVPQNYYNNSPKNESLGIYNNDALVAILGGLIKKQTTEIKARLIDG
jgi:hypothetical protein